MGSNWVHPVWFLWLLPFSYVLAGRTNREKRSAQLSVNDMTIKRTQPVYDKGPHTGIWVQTFIKQQEETNSDKNGMGKCHGERGSFLSLALKGGVRNERRKRLSPAQETWICRWSGGGRGLGSRRRHEGGEKPGAGRYMAVWGGGAEEQSTL